MKKFLAAAALAALAASQAGATVTVDGVAYQDSAKVGSAQLVLNGAGLRKKIFFKVYTAGLYVPRKASGAAALLSQQGAARVRLVLRRDVSASSFVGALNDGISDNTPPAEQKAIAGDIDKLIAMMKRIGDVKTGDVVDIDFAPAAGTLVAINGKTVGSHIGGRPLFNAVLRIWLGDKAIDDDLKAALAH